MFFHTKYAAILDLNGWVSSCGVKTTKKSAKKPKTADKQGAYSVCIDLAVPAVSGDLQANR